jgi:hypothetical protein
MITKNQAEQILIDNIKCDTVIRDLLKEVPGQNNVVTRKLPNGGILEYVGNAWGLLSATYGYEGADDCYTFDFTSLNNVHPKSGLASMWQRLTFILAGYDGVRDSILGYGRYFSLLGLDFEYLPQHSDIIEWLGEAPTFFLPNVKSYSLHDDNKKGVYIHVHDLYSSCGVKQLDQREIGHAHNLYFAIKLPQCNYQFDTEVASDELLSSRYLLVQCHDDFYVTDPQILSMKLEKQTAKGIEKDRLAIPVDELIETHDWLEERAKDGYLK